MPEAPATTTAQNPEPSTPDPGSAGATSAVATLVGVVTRRKPETPHPAFVDHPEWLVAARWLFLIGCTALGFWNTIVAIVDELMAQTLILYVPVLVVLALIAVIGVSWRTVDELPIYDRQTDVIVGIVVLILALAMKYLVNPRYARAYLTTHMDLLALWLFVFGAAVLLFGLRPVARYRWVWLLLVLIFPPPVRAVVLIMGGTSLAAGFVVVLMAVAATAIAVGRTWRRKLVAALLAGAVGLVALFVLDALGAPRNIVVPYPGLIAALATSAYMLVDYRRRGGRQWSPPEAGRISPPKVPFVGRPGLVVLLVAVLLALCPTPPVGSNYQSNRYPQLGIGEPLVVPVGWRQESLGVYGWVSRLYGPGSVLIRQVLVQTRGNRAYDKFARPRRVVVDSVDSRRPLVLDVYPDIFRYDLSSERTSLPIEVDLSNGVRGRVWSVVDDERYLTYTALSWRWNNGNRTQQVMLWAVDNHEPEAYFPEPRITILANMNSLMTILLRGNSVLLDTDPQLKDEALLIGLAGELIRAQLGAARGAGA
ncbi:MULTISPECIES: hypothetical protein [unclassified Gordonia (in: high G+C Gram-positive bacteria)]|uniref:hypothetical protein n=1 Tax=Gordonia TaxID=2053 RepID=UPI00071D975E|nr:MULTISPECIES: hypothetical protein [unclassified Gordonia (in: high G+C Gram-positive bacteria)]MCX2754275.1 hypothetical protein [Gordonia sp. 4N]MDT0222680.1 hypothetical protein [Gordonia sp. AC31]SCC42984.1 hypothetical protein GA0061091_11453 [Gordonia sp. v-85]